MIPSFALADRRDQAGECGLQEFSAEHGRGYSRFTEDKNVKLTYQVGAACHSR